MKQSLAISALLAIFFSQAASAGQTAVCDRDITVNITGDYAEVSFNRGSGTLRSSFTLPCQGSLENELVCELTNGSSSSGSRSTFRANQDEATLTFQTWGSVLGYPTNVQHKCHIQK